MKTSLRPAATSSPQRRQQPRDWPYPKARPSGQHPRRQFLRLAASAAALPAVSRVATAQTYPSRPITMIVPSPAGGSLDAVARILTERMRRSLAQPIIIENIGGADGWIGAGRAARAKPDGYTIDLGHLGNHVLNGAVYSLQYDVLNGFAPISPLVGNSGTMRRRWRRRGHGGPSPGGSILTKRWCSTVSAIAASRPVLRSSKLRNSLNCRRRDMGRPLIDDDAQVPPLGLQQHWRLTSTTRGGAGSL
jgi:hypothetical protein